MTYYKEIKRKSGEVNFTTDWYARPYYRDDAEDHQIALCPVAEGAIIIEDPAAIDLDREALQRQLDGFMDYFYPADQKGCRNITGMGRMGHILHAARTLLSLLSAAAGEKP